MAIQAVAFDLDGVLVDSEQVWGRVRERVTNELGGRWHEGAQREMMGMSSTEWSRYMHESLGVPLEPDAISDDVVRRVAAIYRHELPLIDGARDAVERLAAHWPLALASSANRELIDLVLARSGLARFFAATVSSEEVPHGKPEPDVYLEAARRLGADPAACAAVEDSGNGILAARAAGMRTIAIPNREFPPPPDAVAKADVVLGSLAELTPEAVTRRP